MLGTSARLLRLLTLLQARATWTGTDLAARLEVTSRTLRRDVDRLRTLGYPVESTTGAGGGYRLGAGASLPPLHLDEDEATAVFIGLHASAETGVAGTDAASARALGKLQKSLPPRLKRQLAVFRSSVLEIAHRDPTISLSAVTLMSMACSERRALHFTYAAPDGATSERTVEPHRLVAIGTRWYLLAWDRRRDAWRTFRIDRIRAAHADAQRFNARPPPHDDVVRYVSESLGSSPYRYRARVLLRAPIAVIRKRWTPFEGTLEARGSGATLLETGAPTLHALALTVALFGVDFEVVDPPAFREYVGTLAKRFTRAAAR